MHYVRLISGTLAGGALFLLSGCAPNASAVMSQTAQQQVAVATGSIGTPDEVRKEAGDGAQVLRQLSAIASNSGNANPQVVAAFTADAALLSSALDEIAASKTNSQFIAAVFSMCEPQPRGAALRVGQKLVGMANNISASPPKGVPSNQVQQTARYLETFGERMVNVPSQCNQAQAQMAAAQAQLQQAQARHDAYVAAAVNAAELIFAGAVVYESAVASRPVYVQENPPAQITNYNTYIREPQTIAPISPIPGLTVPQAP